MYNWIKISVVNANDIIIFPNERFPMHITVIYKDVPFPNTYPNKILYTFKGWYFTDNSVWSDFSSSSRYPSDVIVLKIT